MLCLVPVFICSLLASFVGAQEAAVAEQEGNKQPSLDGLPGDILRKLQEYRDEEVVDLTTELQETYDWANSQAEWAEFAFPIDQTISDLPLIGDCRLQIDAILFNRFEAAKDDGAPIVERTSYGYRLGLFNIEVDLLGVEITTYGFFSSSHVGDMHMELLDCYLDIEMVEGQLIPNVSGKIGSASYSFSSPSVMTQIMLTPLLLVAEPMISETIEQAFAYYMTQFWLPVDMEFYISAAADCYLESDASTAGLEAVELDDFAEIDAEAIADDQETEGEEENNYEDEEVVEEAQEEEPTDIFIAGPQKELFIAA